ncbi:non-ribosomal peptide synthase/polyketide synthase [Oxalobacteraceae bacterium A2-2]
MKTSDLNRLDIEAREQLLKAARAAKLQRRSASAAPIARATEQERAMPSFAQQRLWFLAQMDGASAAYHIPYGLRLDGSLEPELLGRALDRIVARHEALRTGFDSIDGQPRQRILPPQVGCPLERHDLESHPHAEAELQRLAAVEAGAPFDLGTGPLLRARLVRLGAQQHVLLVTLHHIVADGWSMGVLVRELGTLYAALLEGHDDPLPALPVQYADYAAWQRSALRTQVEAQGEYWKRTLSGAPALLELPSDRVRPARQDYAGGSLPCVLDAGLTASLKALSQRHGATLFVTLLASWAALLSRLSGQDEVVIGTPHANRSRSELEGMIGFFVNMLALRVDLAAAPTVAELLEQVKASTLAAQQNVDIPFEQVVEQVRPARSLAHSPLFQVAFAWQNTPQELLAMPGLASVALPPSPATTAKFDLSLSLEERDGRITGTLEYASALFDAATVERYLGHWRVLLEAMAAGQPAPVGRLPLLDAAQRHELTHVWNDTAVDFPRGLCIHELFEAHAARQPDAPALKHGSTLLTYAGLNARANRLAHYLRGLGVGPDRRVAICLERGPEVVLAILAVLKAGGAYVPMDPAYPAERLAATLADSEAVALLTDAGLAGAWSAAAVAGGMHLVDLAAGPGPWERCPDANLAPAELGLASSNMAYLIYTSGSTGVPKGVMVGHDNLCNLILDWTTRYPLAAGEAPDYASCWGSFGFDASVFEVFVPFAYGACLTLVPEQVRVDAELLLAWLVDNRITLGYLPPFLIRSLAEAPEQCVAALSLKQVMVGVEPLHESELRRLMDLRPGLAIINAYGPTETTVLSTTYSHIRALPRNAPIGRPIGNTRVYILDRHLQPVPVGVAGELHIGGHGVSRGYLKRPELTAERFIEDPFVPGARMYKTGDLARFHPDGNIEFMGRNDFQVKLRGFRIELGEIESRLTAHPDLAEAAVLARDTGAGTNLVAYYVPARAPGRDAVTAESLRLHLAASLPEFMVPAIYVRLDSLPLTTNGKLDRKALPEPELQAADGHYEAPRGGLETVLAEIWSGLLKTGPVSRHDNFFALGGHSLLAVQMMSRLRHQLGLEISVGAVFAHPVLSDLARELGAAGADAVQVIQPAGGEDRLALSFAQQRLWFLAQIDGGSEAYHIPYALQLEGALDREALVRALDRIVARHEALRTTFVEAGGQPRQCIGAPDAGCALLEHDLGAHADPQAALEHLMALEARAPFDLRAGPLVRARLVRLAAQRHVLLLTQHHIVSDGWSMGVLVRELGVLYSAFRAGAGDPLPALAVQYADYAAWQRGALSEPIAAQGEYWKRTLAGAPALLELPADRQRPARQDYAGAYLPYALDAELSASLRTLSQRHGTTLFMTLLASWAALLSRLSGQQEVVIGTPHANRARSELENMIGFFVNTLALRIDLGGSPSVATLLERVRQHTLAAQQNVDIPFEQVVEQVRPVRSLAHSPLFQAMFVWQGAAQAAPVLEGLATRSMELPHGGTAKFDISLGLHEQDGRIEGGVEYATALFDAATVARYLGYWRTLLEAMVADAGQPVDRLPLLQAAERSAIIDGFNAPATAPAAIGQACIHALFEAQVARTPDAPALLVEGQTLSYAELNARANRLAHHLRSLGVRPDQRVALCLERGASMVTALLAVLKSGGAYVPLDPDYPQERLAHMLRDSAPVALLTETGVGGAWRAALQDAAPALPVLDLSDPAPWASQPGANPAAAATPANLAYVIYTSGSTGLPKGVMNEHAGVVNRLLWGQAHYGMAAGERVLQKTPYSFDVSVWEFFWPLSCGAQLVMARPGGHRDPHYLARLIAQAGITTIHFVPSMLQVFLGQEGSDTSSLRRVMCSGEALPYALQQRVRERMPQVELHNLYGPTEAAIEATHWRCGDAHPGIVPIGHPIANVRMYILDAHGEPVPAGVAGELHIAGVGVARGYLNRPELTAERFVADPFVAGGRMYRTGDLARHLPDGAIEYLGRNDFQVKVNGLRIELGEIESRLLEHAGVAEVVVTARQDELGTRLVAYYVAGGELAAESLRAHLGASLPEFMVPAIYVRLDALPLSANGKLDRKALPEPDLHGRDDRYEAPQEGLETALAGIWEELLKTGPISRHDNFFALGGHSLLAVQLLSRLRQRLDLEISLGAIFARPVLSDLARSLAAAGKGRQDAVLQPLVAAMGEQREQLSYAQQRLWFLTQMEGGSEAYHMPYALQLEGALDREALVRALDRIVARHEALRTTFVEAGGQPRQCIGAPDAGCALLEHDLGVHADPQAALEHLMALEARAPFDLRAGPLVRARLVRLAAQRHVLLLTQHHIVSDGWSMGVLVRELGVLYSAFRAGAGDPLPALAVQYADYAAWQRGALSEPIAAQGEYWKRTLAGAPALLELPADRQRPARQDYAGAYLPYALDAELSASLRTLSQRHGTTLFMTLLASWAALLSRLSGQQEVVIGTPHANRARSELENMIGFFVNTLALRIDLGGSPSVATLLERVRQHTLAAQQNVDIPFEQVVEQVRPVRSLAHSPLFQAMFVWQGAAQAAPVLEGLATRSMELPHGGTAKFDISLGLHEQDGRIEGGVEYATALFDAATVARYLGYWRTLLEAMVADAGQPVDRLPLLQAAERSAIIDGFNAPATAPAAIGQACIHALFEAQVARTPDAPALLVEGQTLSYAELNARANRLAHHLRSLGVRPDQRVALCLERGASMVTALLAVLKSGGAYVPLDPDYPQERLAHMLRDSAPVALLTETGVGGAWRAALQDAAPALPVLDLSDPAPWASQPGANPAAAATPANLAYVIYTSGSTGLPKGVMNEHAGVVNRLLWGQAHYGMAAGERVLQKTPYSFDVSVWEFFWPLSCGAQLVMARPGGHRDPHYLARLIAQAGITTIHFVPSMLQVFLGQEGSDTSSLRRVMCSGEALPYALQQRVRERMPQVELHNLYGPTEAAIEATHWRCGDAHPGIVPIGHPIANVRMYILDAHGEPVPAGVAGELHIAGVGVARGYLNRPELTAERFVADPFVAGGRMYRTGDLARHLPDGAIEYLGRNDFQVKVNGLRIELGEIESRLLEHAGVAEAVVTARQDELGTRLVAYYVASGELAAESLRAHLGASLPEFMVPAIYVRLDSLPLSANGKLDRKALPEPQAQAAHVPYQAPEGEIEIRLAAIWAELLKATNPVGRHDNFFALGGHSLLAIQLASRVRAELGITMGLRALFEAPTLAELALTLPAPGPAVREGSIVAASRQQRLPLSHAQERLWFLQALEGPSATYNVVAALRLLGKVDDSLLSASLLQLAQRHEILRTNFVTGDSGEACLRIADTLDVPLAVTEAQPGEVCARLQANAGFVFNLADGPLLKTELVRLAPEESVLVLTVHHIVCDGWSMGLMLDEWLTLYDAMACGRTPDLAPLPLQYADYACWQRSAQQQAALERQLAFWVRKLDQAPELLNLPTDRPRPAIQRFEGAAEHMLVAPELARRLRALSLDSGASLFMTLVSAFSLLMSRYSGESDVLVGTPAVNRDRKELEGLVGLFLNTLVLRTDTSGRPSFRQLLERTRQCVLEAYENSDVPFERIVDALPLQRDLSRNPLFQVFFNMLNLPSAAPMLDSLRCEELGADDAGSMQFDAKFELTLYAQDTAAGLDLHLVYNRGLFDAERMRELLRQYALLLEQAAAAPDDCIDSYQLLTPEARAVLPDPAAVLATGWAGAVHEMFVDCQAARPDAMAIVSHERSWTYAELHEQSERIACHLQAHGVVRGDIVAIHAARNAMVAAAVLGTLKAGAAFMMLDPVYPCAHLEACLEAGGPRAFINVEPDPIEAGKAALLAAIPVRLDLGGAGQAELEQYAGWRAQPVPVDQDDLALIAFTSGSTGKPKAVEGRHGPLSHFIPWLGGYFGLGREDRYSMLSGLAHDPLQRDIFTTLCLGATLHIPDPELITPQRLARWMARERVTVAHLTPAMAQVLSEAPPELVLPDLRYVFLVGDVLTRRDVQRLRALAPAMRVVNYYGSTETQRSVSYYEVSRETPAQALREVIPLGRGIPGVQLLVLNPAGRQAGIGEHGEVYMRSAHMARGYRGDPELTAQRFLPNPYGAGVHDRLYRTGDLGRYLPNGMVECLGRADTQVKLRGFRIELGHIESLLGQHPAVQEAVVVARADGGREKCLAAYIVSHGEAPKSAALRQFLAARLPDYMQPAAYVFLDALPLTPNGKVNRKVLPAPELEEGGAAYVAPATAQESAMAALWESVLQREQIGVNDNFFALGGHSLLATRLANLIGERLGVALPLRALFEHPTIAGLCARVADSARDGAGAAIPPCGRAAPLPASYAQQRMWFIDRLGAGSAEYNLPLPLELEGELDTSALRQALQAIVDRHEVLRTTIEAGADGQPLQRIHAHAAVAYTEHDLRGLDGDARRQALARLCAGEAAAPFDLGRDVMLRAQLCRLDQQRHHLLLTRHHIAADGWSLGILLRELNTLYNALRAGRQPALAPLEVQYADYSQWQRSQLQGERLERALAYWSAQLAGLPVAHSLPLDQPRPAAQRFRGAAHGQVADAALLEQIKRYCRREQVTLFMFMHTAFSILLGRYSNQTDIVCGTPIAGRAHAAAAPLIGLFVNNLVLRCDLSGNPRFRDLLERNKQMVLAAYEHQSVPFEMLVERLQPERSLSHSPLFQILLTLHNNERHAIDMDGLRVTPLAAPERAVKYDLELAMGESDAGLEIEWQYSVDLFKQATVARMAANFEVLLRAIVADGETRIGELPLLTLQERQRLLTAGYGSAQAYPDATLHGLFQAQVERTPSALAVSDGDTVLSYAQLNDRANRLAQYLRRQGVEADTLVGLCLRRSARMVVAMLAIAKTGAAYVPLDPDYPQARLAYMLDDAQVRVVLTEGDLAAGLEALDLRTVCPDDQAVQAALSVCSGANRAGEAGHPDQLAYVIYTSGSTGNPKGVCIQHRALCNLLQSMAQSPGMGGRDRLLAVTSVSFDIAGLELFLPLVRGAQLHIASAEAARDSQQLQELIARHRITMMQATPSTWRLLLDGGWQGAPGLAALCGGEAWPATLNRELQSRVGSVWNVYGPTETTIWSTIERVPAGAAAVALGKPIANTGVYVLDEHRNLAPWGGVGELYIGGAGLARGYWNRAELTAERFIASPFDRGARLYRTGDLVRWNAEHKLEYLGRQDFQVKLRGFRIECGEIEAVLEGHPEVNQAAVALTRKPDGDAFLTAYLVLADGALKEDPRPDRLRRIAAASLAPYMVPSCYVVLERFPLTLNGKLDRKALPAPEWRREAAADMERPANDAERAVADVWGEVLGMAPGLIGAQDSFFELGGHSLLVLQVANRLNARFDAGLQIRDVFAHPTVRQLALLVERAAGQGGDAALPALAAATGLAPCPSLAQEGLLYINQFTRGDDIGYNMPFAFHLRGALDHGALERALNTVLERHQVLRSRFPLPRDEHEARRVELGGLRLSIAVEDVGADQVAARVAANAATPFDLEHGPLLRAGLLRTAPERHVLLLNVHHAVFDGWSIGILMRELTALYAARAPLPPVALQYYDYAHWQRRCMDTPAYRRQVDYWRGALDRAPQLLALPLDRERPPLQDNRGAMLGYTVEAPLATALRRLASACNVTLPMLMLAVLKVQLWQYSDQDDLVVGVASANRLRPELEGVIGMFVNTLPVRTRIDGEAGFGSLLAQVREGMLGAFDHADVPVDHLVDIANPKRSLAHDPLFQVMYAFHSMPAGDLSLDGVEINQIAPHVVSAKADLAFSLQEQGEAISVHVSYRTGLFEAGTIARLAQHYLVLLETVAAGTANSLFDLPLPPSAPASRPAGTRVLRSEGDLLDLFSAG